MMHLRQMEDYTCATDGELCSCL